MNATKNALILLALQNKYNYYCALKELEWADDNYKIACERYNVVFKMHLLAYRLETPTDAEIYNFNYVCPQYKKREELFKIKCDAQNLVRTLDEIYEKSLKEYKEYHAPIINVVKFFLLKLNKFVKNI